jgi:hypothetical protein
LTGVGLQFNNAAIKILVRIKACDNPSDEDKKEVFDKFIEEMEPF